MGVAKAKDSVEGRGDVLSAGKTGGRAWGCDRTMQSNRPNGVGWGYEQHSKQSKRNCFCKFYQQLKERRVSMQTDTRRFLYDGHAQINRYNIKPQIPRPLSPERSLLCKGRYLLYCGWNDRYSNRTENSCYDGGNRD